MALYGFKEELGMALTPQGSGPFGVVDGTIKTGVHPGESGGSQYCFCPWQCTPSWIFSAMGFCQLAWQIVSPGPPAEPLHVPQGLLFLSLWQL